MTANPDTQNRAKPLAVLATVAVRCSEGQVTWTDCSGALAAAPRSGRCRWDTNRPATPLSDALRCWLTPSESRP